jgi:MerR family transcriptional regulator/heat shock protein HspR
MADKADEPVYVISVAARLCEMHPQTLRGYEKLGLVHPRRADNRNRLYSESDIERLRQIQRLTRDLGVNLAGVEVILDLLDRLEAQRAEMQREIARLHNQMKAL